MLSVDVVMEDMSLNLSFIPVSALSFTLPYTAGSREALSVFLIPVEKFPFSSGVGRVRRRGVPPRASRTCLATAGEGGGGQGVVGLLDISLLR